LQNKVRAQKYQIDEIKRKEVNLEKQIWQFEREKQMQKIAYKKI